MFQPWCLSERDEIWIQCPLLTWSAMPRAFGHTARTWLLDCRHLEGRFRKKTDINLGGYSPPTKSLLQEVSAWPGV